MDVLSACSIANTPKWSRRPAGEACLRVDGGSVRKDILKSDSWSQAGAAEDEALVVIQKVHHQDSGTTADWRGATTRVLPKKGMA
jgi:hypothetical protein